MLLIFLIVRLDCLIDRLYSGEVLATSALGSSEGTSAIFAAFAGAAEFGLASFV